MLTTVSEVDRELPPREVAEVIEAWCSSPVRSHDGRLFDAVRDLAEAHGIDLVASASIGKEKQ